LINFSSKINLNFVILRKKLKEKFILKICFDLKLIHKMTSTIKFDILIAINSQGVIGIESYGVSELPWPYLKEDMNFFRKTTSNCPSGQQNAIIVGYKTWKTLSTAYKKHTSRLNIVVARNSQTLIPTDKEIYVETFDQAYNFASELQRINKIYVIGGSSIYTLAFMHKAIGSIMLTYIHDSYPNFSDVKLVKAPFTVDQLNYIAVNPKIITKTEGLTFTETVYNIKYQFLTYKIHDQSGFVTELPLPDLTSKVLTYKDVSNHVVDTQYGSLVRKIMSDGRIEGGRNGATKYIWGYQLTYDLSKGYPIATEKRSYPKAIFEELMWMLRGQTDNSILQAKGVHVWDKNSSLEFIKSRNLTYEEGDIGAGYGFQMRYYGATYVNCKTNYKGQGVDQVAKVIDKLKNNPKDRRIIMDLWNPADEDKMCLPPCHPWYHFGVDLYDQSEIVPGSPIGKLNCHLTQRSWDVLLGWNTATAALITYLFAAHCNLDPGMLVHSISNAHLYKEHIDTGAIDELLDRQLRIQPKLQVVKTHANIEDYEFDDLRITNYYPCPPIKADMAA
jgi:dihydrofolate reductase/thymidylate synthase